MQKAVSIETESYVRNYEIPGLSGRTVICDIINGGRFSYRRPALLFFHGGGFVGGSKDQFLGAASWLSLRTEAVCITIDYCLATELPCPAALIDGLSVFQWVWEKRDILRIDPEQVFAIGGSPGANIAAMAMFAQKKHLPGIKMELKNIFRPDNGIFLNGIYDFRDFYERNPEERIRVCRYFNCETYDEKMADLYSPCRNVSGNFNIMMIHGSKDTVVPVSQCEQMKKCLEEKGSRAWICSFSGKQHAWFNQADEMYAVWEKIAAFVEFRRNEVMRNGAFQSRRII